MSHTFARAGYKIEMLEEVPGVPSPDVLINGVKADLKSTKGHGNIVSYAKESIRKQEQK